MRKSFILFPLMIIAVVFVTACGSETKTANAYQCPMQCEGEKTYDKAGQCPVCEMDLEGVVSTK